MSLSRKTVISQYDIREPELKSLIDALCEKPEDANNMSIIKNALRGDYSDFGSRHAMPQFVLADHFKTAGYDDLIPRIYAGDFDHNYGPKPNVTHPNHEGAAANRARQEQSMFTMLKALSDNPKITMGEMDEVMRAEEAKGFKLN